jgi:hypothetical protein
MLAAARAFLHQLQNADFYSSSFFFGTFNAKGAAGDAEAVG